MRQEAAGTLQRRQLGEGYGGGVGEKKKKRSGREDWTCKLCARKLILYNVRPLPEAKL